MRKSCGSGDCSIRISSGGYDSVNPLSAKEKEALPYIVFSIQMICVAYFSESEKYAELAEINQKMLRQLIAHRDMLAME